MQLVIKVDEDFEESQLLNGLIVVPGITWSVETSASRTAMFLDLEVHIDNENSLSFKSYQPQDKI